MISGDQIEEGIDDCGDESGKHCEKGQQGSRIRAWRWRKAEWWRWIELTRNTKSRRKLVPQVRCGAYTEKSGLWPWDWSQLMVGPVRMIEWIEKAGLRWDRTGNIEKKSGGVTRSGLEDLGAATTARAIWAFWICWRPFNCLWGKQYYMELQ